MTLSSSWDGLSPHLIASIHEVKRDGGGHYSPAGGETVSCPLVNAQLEVSLTWQSPFESSGAESKAPVLMAMLQSGALQPVVDAVMGAAESATGADLSSARATANSNMRAMMGRTGITKLNSTQIFSGMPPARVTATAIFRAYADPVREVESPMAQLVSWALPEELSDEGSIIARLANPDSGWIETLMPSASPSLVSLTYKGRTYSPMVIESIGVPLDSPIDRDGRFVSLQLPITFATLTAIDRNDWQNNATKKSL